MKPDFAGRRQKVMASIKKLDATSFLVTDPINVRYLTGFTGDSSFLLMTKKQAIMLTDSRYETQLEYEAPDLQLEVRDSRSNMLQLVTSVFKKAKVADVAFEADHVSKALYDGFVSALTTSNWLATSGVVEEKRQVKDRVEIGLIRKSIEIAEKAYRVITAGLTADQTEQHLGYQIEHQIRMFGGEECSFDPIVAVGDHAALPHAVKTNRRIGDSSFVQIDWGAKYQGYASDITRVLAYRKPPAKLLKIYEIVSKAQAAAIAAIRPGVAGSHIDGIARKIIAEAGFDKYFGHGLGHGFGLQIHEFPRLSPIHEAPLQAGMVVTVEPGIYLPGIAGVRLEDDILVTEDGYEILTGLPKNLVFDQVV